MKIKLLIATADHDYAEHLSYILAEKHVDVFEANVCTSPERLRDLLDSNSFDAALLDPEFVSRISLSSIHLPLILTDDSYSDDFNDMKIIRKYQRISSIAGKILELYAETGKKISDFGGKKARVNAVWSPSGGSGKTTVALAYAAQSVSKGKEAIYLDLENFSSTSVYFHDSDRSISKVFDKLEANVGMVLLAMRQKDGDSGIYYFGGPENYDDINILTADDIELLINACAADIDELIVDLSSQCDERVRKIFAMADTVFLVCDPSAASQNKIRQFISQHNTFGDIRDKIVLVNNKGAKTAGIDIQRPVNLPLVQSADPKSVYKTLSSGNFDIGD